MARSTESADPGQRARSAVITGLGAITPSGLSAAALWNAALAGRSAVDVLEGEEFADLAVRIGGQIRGFDPESVVKRTMVRRLEPLHTWALAAGDQALAQAGVLNGQNPQAPTAVLPWNPARFAVYAGTGSGPVRSMQNATRALDADGPRGVPLSLAMHGAPDSAAALASQRYGAQGPARGISATCASGAVAIGQAMRDIRHGYADAVLVLGLEDCLGPVNLASNANLRALAAGYEDHPQSASRPFDSARKGFVMSQGAGAVLLEDGEAAAARAARPLAQVAGFGASSDAYHPTAPHPKGRGAAAAMRECLADAGLPAGTAGSGAGVDHINAHGTGTPAGDAAELAAIAAVFGQPAGTPGEDGQAPATASPAIPITATKSSTGHLLGAGGVIEAIISIGALRTGTIPPTINLDDPDPDFAGFDFVTSPRAAADLPTGRLDTVLSNSFGFGGHNASILLRRIAKDPDQKEGHHDRP